MFFTGGFVARLSVLVLQLICINRFLMFVLKKFYWQCFFLLLTTNSSPIPLLIKNYNFLPRFFTSLWIRQLTYYDLSFPATCAGGNGHTFPLDRIFTFSSSWARKLISCSCCKKCNQWSSFISQTWFKYSTATTTTAKHKFYPCKFLSYLSS